MSHQDTGMYPNSQSARHPAQTLSLNSQYFPPPYDFTGFHHVPGVGDPSTGAWSSMYAPREEYAYSFPGSSPSSAAQASFSSPELSGTPTPAGGGSFTPYNFISGQDPFGPKRRPHETVSGTKTRTKDKYRVVYTDQQRLELEKEFQRAKERKINRKKLQNSQQASTTTPTPPAQGGPADSHIPTSPSSNILSDTISEEY
ncbi:hypothetical protein F7725_010025 [Dissostichus mawsoni]|uniref:Uncharacterized protein n=1 Tax=Dissostichus mawsoni TaxID=36200 RepID=A0A7J5XNV0_DISMA|nr:hypothetical protein F7725_010025 [Dissostichus mawsoni]